MAELPAFFPSCLPAKLIEALPSLSSNRDFADLRLGEGSIRPGLVVASKPIPVSRLNEREPFDHVRDWVRSWYDRACGMGPTHPDRVKRELMVNDPLHAMELAIAIAAIEAEKHNLPFERDRIVTKYLRAGETVVRFDDFPTGTFQVVNSNWSGTDDDRMLCIAPFTAARKQTDRAPGHPEFTIFDKELVGVRSDGMEAAFSHRQTIALSNTVPTIGRVMAPHDRIYWNPEEGGRRNFLHSHMGPSGC